MAATVRGEPDERELGGSPFDLGAASVGTSKSRLPEVLVGTLLVTLFALAGAWFYSTSTERVAYLALRQDVARGEVVERDDFTVYQLTTDAPIRAVPAAGLSGLAGKVALSDMPAGSLAVAEQFSDIDQIPAGSGVVGLDLVPGEFPSFGLRPGDTVRVVAVPGGSAGTQIDAPEILVERAEVVEVGDGGGRGRFVALTMDAEAADRVAVAAARDQVRLIQVRGS